jgi:hypothetical protein
MSEQLRQVWTTTITPEDYEAHMANVGQAQANAILVAEYLAAHPPPRHSSLLFAGAGSGQMFDYVSPEILLPYNVTFTDINAGYLNRLRSRLAHTPDLRYSTVVDDVERPTLSRRFDTILAILILEHVDWRLAIANLCRIAERELFVVIQENPPDAPTALTPGRQIPKTMQVFEKVHPTLIPSAELESEIRARGFVSDYSAHKIVSDEKKMRAFAFRLNALSKSEG